MLIATYIIKWLDKAKQCTPGKDGVFNTKNISLSTGISW